MQHQETYIQTVKERCRVCYTCVRECPAKAIRISDGQAEIIAERCIGCGNCVRVCSQNAKQVKSHVPRVQELLESDEQVAVIVAPSFPAEFPDVPPARVVGMLRRLGFDRVNEVAFGADLVADRYARLLRDASRRFITTSCPAVVEYVQRYEPHLVPRLAPIVSPMVATARALRALHGAELRIVFIGPCIAKKIETDDPELHGEVDVALTFIGIHSMLQEAGITPEHVQPSDFDPPYAALGALFPITRGMLQAAGIAEDLVSNDVVATHGREEFVDSLHEFGAGTLDARMLEVLCCEGCIMGPGMTSKVPYYKRRSEVSRYVRDIHRHRDPAAWRQTMDQLADLDLGRDYRVNDQRLAMPSTDELNAILARLGKHQPEDELKCGACGYDTCRQHAIAIFKGLAESEMCLPYTIDQLKNTCGELARSHEQLAETQEALMQAEKLASMGQLAAGIAHEVNNPLGVVLLYAHMLQEQIQQSEQMYEDVAMIAEQADRCKKIVSGLLHFARQNKVALSPNHMNELVASAVKAFRLPRNVQVHLASDPADPVAEVDKDQMLQILTNLISNALQAMPQGGRVEIGTRDQGDRVELYVADNGYGIPSQQRSKIFEPFYTTKQIGKGTGLGLAVTYGIVKMHNGDIAVQSNDDPQAGPTGTTFTVSLPKSGRKE